MFYTIYKITNRLNNKIYIGKHQTKDLMDGYFGSGKLIKRAINKYGLSNFTKEYLHIFDNEEDMNAKEKELVVVSEETYNLCDGGKGGWSYILRTRSEEEVSRIGKLAGLSGGKVSFNKKVGMFSANAALRLEWNSRGSGNSFFGKTHTEETKKRIGLSNSIKQSGKKNSQYGTCWASHPNLGTKKIDKLDLRNHISSGWIRGRKNSGTM